MLTVATGELGGGKADRAGLVPTHAYAVLNVVEIQVISIVTSLVYADLLRSVQLTRK